MAGEQSELAVLVRRTQPAPQITLVEALDGMDRHDAATTVISRGAEPVAEPSGDGDGWELANWMLTDRLDSGLDGGLRRTMAWFWHTVLPSHHAKTSGTLLARQVETFRRLALSDFTTLMQAYVTDGALLHYLDGDGSIAANPNENLSRELMELYTIGPANYEEVDVRAAARALSGWTVDGESNEVRWERDRGFVAPLVFLGEQREWTTEAVVDRLCSDPATARQIAARVWFQLVGRPPGDADELGRWWAQQDLAIVPLVERIIGDEAFWDPAPARPRSAMEWFAAGAAATGAGRTDDGGVDIWQLTRLGQFPFEPPTPAGWDDGRWITPGQILMRAGVGYELGRSGAPIADPAEVLRRCLITNPSAATLEAMAAIGQRDAGQASADSASADTAAEDSVGWWRIALSAPEFQFQ